MLQDRHAPGCQEFRRREIPAKSRQIHHLLMRQRLQLPVSADRHGAVRMTAFRIFGELARRSASGHEDAFPRPRLSARYVIRQETFAGTHANGRDAPKAAVP